MFRLSCPHMHLHTHTHSSSVVTSHNSISLHTRIMFMTSFLFLSFPVATLPRFPPCHSHMAQFQAPNCSRSVAPDGGRCRRRSRRPSSLSPRLKQPRRSSTTAFSSTRTTPTPTPTSTPTSTPTPTPTPTPTAGSKVSVCPKSRGLLPPLDQGVPF